LGSIKSKTLGDTTHIIMKTQKIFFEFYIFDFYYHFAENKT